MKLRNTALLGGLVRNPGLYKDKVEMLIAWRSEGVLDEIVVSTWLHELSQFSGLREFIEENNIRVVETSAPEVGFKGHAWHQMKTLAFGLDACEPGSAVFKLRGDKVNISQAVKEAIAKRELVPCTQPVDWPHVFDARIMTIAGIATQPFFLNDMVFYGLRQDLAKLINFDVSFQMSGAVMNVEQLFFVSPFKNDFPIFRQFFRVNWGLLHRDDQYVISRFLIKESWRYKFYREAMLTWYLILNYYFSCGLVTSSSAASDAYDEWTLEQFFDIEEPRLRPGVDFSKGINTFNFNDPSFANAIVSNKFAASPFSDMVILSLETLRSFAHQESYSNSYLGLDHEALKWAEFVRNFPVGALGLQHLRPVSEKLWQIQTTPLNISQTP